LARSQLKEEIDENREADEAEEETGKGSGVACETCQGRVAQNPDSTISEKRHDTSVTRIFAKFLERGNKSSMVRPSTRRAI
jgi:hypothetical protein